MAQGTPASPAAPEPGAGDPAAAPAGTVHVAHAAPEAAGPGQPGLKHDDFTVAQDSRPTYFSYYWGRLPVWLQVIIVWAVSRLITTVLLAIFADNQDETWQTPERPDLFTFSTIWDAEWYERIASGGYPSELPRNDEGRITENAWAFMPVYPMIVRAIMLVTTLPFSVAAVIVSLLCGLGAAFVFNRLLRHLVDGGTAMFATLLFCIAPTSPMLQVGYAESMQMFFVALLLLLLVEKQWLVMVPVIIVASLTRPTGLAWAMTLGLYLVYRWWRARGGRDMFPPREQLAVLGVTALSVLAGFAWLLTAWAVTGDFHAYLETELAWRSHYTGPGELVPFTAWFHGGYYWIGWFWPELFPEGSVARTVGSVVIVGVIIATIAVLLALPVAKRLGIEVRLWLISYFTYLVAVFFPQSSTFRLLMPMFPSLAVVALPRSPVYRVVVVALSIVGQVIWIYLFWYAIGQDWTPP